ncbi:MAG: alpha/beta fold hydrolase [Kiloniellaceae bacterium]
MTRVLARWRVFLAGALLALGTGCAQMQGEPPMLAYELYGSGPEKVIVLHDWLGDRHNYDPARPYLDTAAFTFAFVDLRGYGDSMDIPGAFNENEAAGDVIHLANELGWDRFHIIGHSMTGMVVQRVAANAPLRVVSVIATTPVSAAGMQTDADTYGFLEGAAKDPEVMAQAIQALTGKRLSALWADFKVQRALARSTEAARLGYLEMFDKSDFHADVQGLKMPVTVILGQNDLPFFQPDYIAGTFGKWYADLTVVVSPNAGHYPMQETPVFYASVVDAQLKAHPTQ